MIQPIVEVRGNPVTNRTDAIVLTASPIKKMGRLGRFAPNWVFITFLNYNSFLNHISAIKKFCKKIKI